MTDHVHVRRPFRDVAHDLVAYHKPRDAGTAAKLDSIRFAFDDLIDRVDLVMPAGTASAEADTDVAAHVIHQACQACIFAVVHNQQNVQAMAELVEQIEDDGTRVPRPQA